MVINYEPSEATTALLETLAETGLFGETIDEVVDRLLSEKLREMMEQDWFQAHWLPEDWAEEEEDEGDEPEDPTAE